MRRNLPAYLVVIIFFIILLFVPLYWVFWMNPNSGLSWLEGRQLAGFDSLVHRGFISGLKTMVSGDFHQGAAVFQQELVDRAFQKDLEAVLSDQFPWRQAFIKTAKSVDRAAINLAYLFLPDPAIPADRKTGYYITRDRSAILAGPEPFRASTLQVIDNRIANYQTLIDNHPEIIFYTYYIERIQNVSAHPLDSYFSNLERGRYYDYFIKHKPDLLLVEKLNIESFEDHLSYFYRTDHHWNMQGVFHAYDEIYAMLRQNYPEISVRLSPENFVTNKTIAFRGSLARKTFFPISEPFIITDYSRLLHQVYDNGKLTLYSSNADYMAGAYPQDPYYNHYEGEFGRDWAMIELVSPGSYDRNLLVIGNSYDNALVPLLASHYHHTYDVDLRYFPDFSLSAFLDAHPVDDILVIGENAIVFGSERYEIQP